ncbi:MAG TPA: nitronate monooxygenase [Mycobacteriales bacterium]|nr:nitronate monooxygenase [Mycobacteriales bacterium]
MAWRETVATRALEISLPIVGGPMAGGPSTPALAAAVSEAGGIGVLGCGYDTPDAVRAAITEVRRLTSKPFGVNLFVPTSYEIDEGVIAAAIEALRPFAAKYDVELTADPPYAEDFEAQLEVIAAERVPLFSFTFGVPRPELLAALRDAGSLTCGTATSLAEAIALRDADVDLICLQGTEAGGHRGGFIGPPEDSLVGISTLVAAAREAVDLPLIAAGGIMDGRGIAAALVSGAGAAQLGTAFLRCPEAGTSAPYRAALDGARDTDTVITKAFSGRAARGIRNELSQALASIPVPAYPVMNKLTRELRRRAAATGDSSMLSLWAGHGVAQGRALPARELIVALEEETDAAFSGFDG